MKLEVGKRYLVNINSKLVGLTCIKCLEETETCYKIKFDISKEKMWIKKDWDGKIIEEIPDISKSNKKDLLNEAEEIISFLMSYSKIRPITSVAYREGTHQDFVELAENWLNKYKDSK